LAAKLAAMYGVCRTASALQLDYYGLQRRAAQCTAVLADRSRSWESSRVAPSSRAAAERGKTSPKITTGRFAGGSVRSGTAGQRLAFLQVPAALLASPGECIIDFENGHGAKMRVHLKGMAATDLAALVRSLGSAP
jgi:hypothetical protein